jgi:hypothetical protein
MRNRAAREGAGEDVLTGFGLGHEGDGEIVHLVAEFGGIADVFQGHGKRHVANAEFGNAERARILRRREVRHRGGIESRVHTTRSGGAGAAHDEVDALAWRDRVQGIEFRGTQAEEVDGLLDGGVLEVDARNDDAA